MSDADDLKPSTLPPSTSPSTIDSSSKPALLNGHEDTLTGSKLTTDTPTVATTKTTRIRFNDNIEDDSTAGTSSSPYTPSTSFPSGRRRKEFSPQSQELIDESERLLQMRPSIGDFRSRGLASTASSSVLGARDNDDYDLPGTSSYFASSSHYRRRSPLATSSSAVSIDVPTTTPRYAMHTPAFPRMDMDDVRDDLAGSRKPAWRELQDNVKDSYHKPRRTVERHKELNDFMDLNLSRRRSRRSQSPFTHLDSESFLPRPSSWFTSGAMQPRGLGTSASLANIDMSGSGPYAAPALGRSKGIESRYDKMVDDVELRLLKTTLLPDYMKTVTKHEFRRAPNPSSGSVAEEILTDAEISGFAARPFYSRPSRRDPDYFDFDLEHSVNMYRKPEGRYFPRGPQDWENKVISEVRAKGDAPVAGHMFARPNNDWRSTGTSYLSAALRTPSFWEHRFANIGTQVRDSNPISMASLERNRPTPNKFTSYKDPDFEGLSDPEDS
ncbi:hypothetical protein M3Y94_00414400 [Aphelenchoides besseyi]|nr:hypothetical protein M3Y94_00414400 [Aphelenchoides besseyi]